MRRTNSTKNLAKGQTGLSVLSGSHLELVGDLMRRLKKVKLNSLPVVVGGIIPEADKSKLRKLGVKKVYTPKNYELDQILCEISDLVTS